MKEKIAQSTVRVNKTTLKALNLLRVNEEHKSIDAAIVHLLKVYQGK